MARMHDAAADFSLPAGAERPSWRDEFRGLAGELPRSETGLWQTIDATQALFDSLPTAPDAYGLVHFDLSGDNLIWDGLLPTAIDFDDTMWHWYVGDIARTTAYFRHDEGGRVGARETAFLEGYCEVRPLSDYWRDLLPEFLRFSLISELAWMSYASANGADVEEFTAQQETALRRAIDLYSGA
jgi:Ser/Thr protein kinase RdoA (MazF antagonist)